MAGPLKLSYAQVEMIVAGRLRIDDSRTPALRAALKALRRLGVPLAGGVGTGTRFAYGMDELLQIVFAMELTNGLFMPQQAAATIAADWATVRREAAAILGELRYDGGGVAQRSRPAGARLLVIETAAHSRWSRPATDEAEQQWQRPDTPGSLAMLDVDHLAARLGAGSVDAPPRPVTILDPWAIVGSVADLLVATGWAAPDQLNMG